MNKDWTYLEQLSANETSNSLNTEINKAIEFYAPLKKITPKKKYKHILHGSQQD